MHECPNCGGGLVFDIPSQNLKCEYCESIFDPYVKIRSKNASEVNVPEESYEANIFTCAQCGGEIISTSNEMAGFCSYCGSSTVFTSRITTEKSPQYIIPFQVSKEDCKKEYAKLLARAVFAPKEMRAPQYIDGFRGIYMPYHVYGVKQDVRVSMDGKKSYRSGNYDITDYYDNSADVDAYYKGLAYDASSSFDDDISEKIAPFDAKEMKPFSDSYLSGFYADIQDVDSSVYEANAIEFANKNTYKSFAEHPSFARKGIKNFDSSQNDSYSNRFHTRIKERDRAMFPVWFLSYRNGERVAYATVNGQTGKVAADMPIDVKKYMTGVLLVTIPLFILLNLMISMKAKNMLTLAAYLAAASIFLFWEEAKKIKKRENDGSPSRKPEGKKKKETSLVQRLEYTWAIFFGVMLCMVCYTGIKDLVMYGVSMQFPVVTAPAFIAGIIGSMMSHKVWTGNNIMGRVPGYIWSLGAIVLATVVAVWNPVADTFYYAGAILSIAGVSISIFEIILAYNILATRKLPQFHRTGGDDSGV